MHRKHFVYTVVLILALFLCSCHNSKVKNPIANVDSKQPDKVLFDRAVEAMRNNKYDVARLSLQTLINTYPDSEYIARAKLGVADSWYAEGGTSGLAQAEIEYKDFQTFFPNMAEAAEAQLKVANIHYRQMEKADRDPNQARRAEDEYRALITMYPDSKLVPEAKARLLEVQEILAERDFDIGQFYFLRQSYPAAIARLQSLVDQYPLSSETSTSLFLLGQSYEAEKSQLDTLKLTETVKAKLDKEFTDKAAAAYSLIVSKYPNEIPVNDAKARLNAMLRPIPVPTPEDIAFNKQVMDSRGTPTRYEKVSSIFKHGPIVASTTRVGEPVLVDAKPTNAPDIVRGIYVSAVMAATTDTTTPASATDASKTTSTPPPSTDTSTSTTGVQIINRTDVKLGPNGEPPKSDAAPGSAAPETAGAPLPPPVQVNDANNPDQNKPATSSSSSTTSATTANGDQKTDADKKEESTSKKKKKGFFRKLIPIG